MKWSDFFKKLGIDLESEVNETSTEASELNNVEIKKDSVEQTTETKKVEEDNKMAFKAPKVDKNGFYDLTDIEDVDMKEFFKSRNTERKTELAARKAEDDKRAVNDAITKYASGIKFAEGWGLDDALKLGDFSKVTNDENISKEIENAFTNLKAAKAGMFVADKKEAKTSNPMLEGFNPQNAQTTGAEANSFMEAFSMME